MGISLILSTLFICTFGDSKVHKFGFDGKLEFLDEYLSELFKSYTGATNVDLSKCLTKEFLSKFEENLQTTVNSLLAYEFDQGIIGVYILIDDVVRISNFCDSGFSIPISILIDHGINFGFYVNSVKNFANIVEYSAKSLDALNIGNFREAGKNHGLVLRTLLPLDKKPYPSNEEYAQFMSGFISETSDNRLLQNCRTTITEVYESAEKVFNQGMEIVGGNLIALTTIFFEANTLLKSSRSLNDNCMIGKTYSRITNLLSLEGIKFVLYRYYSNRENLIERFENLIANSQTPHQSGVSFGEIFKLVLGWDNESSNTEKFPQAEFIKVLEKNLNQECEEKLVSKLDEYKKINSEYQDKARDIERAFNKIKSKVMNYTSKCGYGPLLMITKLTPKGLQQILNDLFPKASTTSQFAREDL